MRGAWLPIVVFLCIQLLSVMSYPVTIYPRDRRWIPDRFANEDFGVDNGYSHNSPSFDTNNGAPQMHQNYLSYYWPEYFSNGDNSPGDYTGMLFRANDNGNRYGSMDPAQQLQNVQTYSYGQMLKPYAYLGRSQQSVQSPAGRASDPTSRSLLNLDLLNLGQQQASQPQQTIFFDSLTSSLSQQPLIVIMPNQQGTSSFQLPMSGSQVVHPQHHESLLHLKPVSNLESHLQPNLVQGLQEVLQPIAIAQGTQHHGTKMGHLGVLPSNFQTITSSQQNPLKLKLNKAQAHAHQIAKGASHQKPAAEEVASNMNQEIKAKEEVVEAEEIQREVVITETETDQVSNSNQESIVVDEQDVQEQVELVKITDSNIEEAQVNEAESLGANKDVEEIQLVAISENNKDVVSQLLGEEIEVLAISDKVVEENPQQVVSADQVSLTENVEDVESKLVGEEIELSLTEKETDQELEGRAYQAPPSTPYYQPSIYGNNPLANVPLNLVYNGPMPPVPMRPPYYRPQPQPQYSFPQVYGYPSGGSNYPAPGYGYTAPPPQQYLPPYPLTYTSNNGYDTYGMTNGYQPYQPYQPQIGEPGNTGYYTPPPPRSERHIIPNQGHVVQVVQGKPHFG